MSRVTKLTLLFRLTTRSLELQVNLEQEASGGAKMPVLVVKDRFPEAIFTHLLPSKGIEHFYPEAALLRDIRFLGNE